MSNKTKVQPDRKYKIKWKEIPPSSRQAAWWHDHTVNAAVSAMDAPSSASLAATPLRYEEVLAPLTTMAKQAQEVEKILCEARRIQYSLSVGTMERANMDTVCENLDSTYDWLTAQVMVGLTNLPHDLRKEPGYTVHHHVSGEGFASK